MATDFDAFCRDNYAGVVRATALATGVVDVAEDATQEAFIRAAMRWPRVRRMERPVGWVQVVAMNAARRSLKRRPEPRDPTNAVERADNGSDHATQVTRRVAILQALAALPPRQRAAVVLRYLAELSVAETARALGVTQGTVKRSTSDALANLRIGMEGDDDAT